MKWSILTVFCLRFIWSYKFDDVSIRNVYYFARRCLMFVKCVFIGFYAVHWIKPFQCVRYFIFIWWFSYQIESAGCSVFFRFMCAAFFLQIVDWSASKIVRLLPLPLFPHFVTFFPFCLFFSHLFCFDFVFSFFFLNTFFFSVYYDRSSTGSSYK